MNYTSEEAGILVHALPYIQAYSGKIVVVKYGGNAMIDDDLKRGVARDLALMHSVGMKPILVHGGGPEINAMMARLGKEPEFVDGLRVTDPIALQFRCRAGVSGNSVAQSGLASRSSRRNR